MASVHESNGRSQHDVEEHHTKRAPLGYATWLSVGGAESSANGGVVVDLLVKTRVSNEDGLRETCSL